MKRYSEVVQEFNKVRYYIYCEKCDDAWIDDLFFIGAPKCCPQCAGRILIVREDHILRKEEVKELAKAFIEKEKKRQEEMQKKVQSEAFKKKIMGN